MKKFGKFCTENHRLLWAGAFLLMAAVLGINCFLWKIDPLKGTYHLGGRIAGVFVILLILLLAYAGVMAFLFFKKSDVFKKHQVKIAALTVALFGMAFMFVMPPFSCPDEKYHFLGAYHLSNMMMGVKDDTASRHAMVRKEDADFLLNEHPGIDDYSLLFSAGSWTGKADSELVLFEDEKYYDCFYLGYLPQVIGITIGRLLGLRQLPTMMLARMFSLATFLFFFVLALKTIPFGKELLSLIALFPMTLELISGISYDGIVLGMSFFFIAKVLDLAFMAEKVKRKDIILLTLLMAFLAPIKVTYLLLAFLMFLIPKEKFASKKEYIISAVCMAVFIGTVFLIFRLGKFAEYAAGENTQLDYVDAQSYTFGEILKDPVYSIKVLVNSFWYHAGFWFENMFGAQLGWVDINVPIFFIYGFAILLFMTAIKPAEEPVYFKRGSRALLWLVFGLIAFLIVLSMMVAWTPTGYPVVLGVQGRYFLPILPLSIFAVRGTCFRRSEETTPWIMYGAVLLNICVYLSIFETVMQRMGE